jgi:cytochrome c oxidase assembly protein subunit 15
VRVLCFSVLGLVIFQGLLGGLRVIWVDLKLAVVHGITAQLFFCTATLAAMVTSNWWNKAPNLAWSEDYPSGRRLLAIAWIAFGVVFGQLVVGAMMRHYQAGLAIPDLPLVYGQVLPPMSAEGMNAANGMRTRTFDAEREALIKAHDDDRARQLPTDRMTLAQAWLAFGHRLGAILATIAIVTLIVKVIRQHDGRKLLLQPAIILSLLLVTQITLGVYTVLKRKPADVASAHVAVGATVLVFCFMLAVRSMRLYSRRFRQRTECVQVDVKNVGPKGFLVS